MLLDLLPGHICRDAIEPFTRRPQKKHHCLNIVNFVESLKKVHSIYCYSLLDSMEEIRELNCRMLLSIARLSWCFMEFDVLSYIVRCNIRCDVFGAHYGLPSGVEYGEYLSRNVENIQKIIDGEYKQSKSRVYRLWGILSICQRSKFIDFYSKKYPISFMPVI